MKKHTSTKFVASLLLCSFLVYVPVACCCDDENKAKFEKTERLSAPCAPGQTLCLQNKVGEISVAGADVSECSVTAVITAKAETEEQAEKIAGQVSVKLEPSGDKLYVKVESPDNKPKCSITVDFNITVPKQTALQIETNVGEITVTDITKAVKIESNVGAVSCKEITDNVEVKTNVGQVIVLYSKNAPAVCSANVKTDVGEIDFTAPPDLSAQVDLSANLGSIETNLPLTVKGMLNQKASGTVGKGEGSVTLKTNIGSIKIK